MLVVYYDFETTGLDCALDDVTQLAVDCVVVGASGSCSVATYSTLVHTTKVLRSFITDFTGITQADVAGAPPFATAYAHLTRTIDAACEAHGVRDCVWVAHNGFAFDARFLARYVQAAEAEATVVMEASAETGAGAGADIGADEDGGASTPALPTLRTGARRRFWQADVLPLARGFDYAATGRQGPRRHRLQDLVQWWGVSTGALHRADADVAALRGVVERMLAHDPGCVLREVVPDTYFTDALDATKVATRVDFDALVGVHGQTIRWTPQQAAILSAPLDAHTCVVAGAGCAKTTTLLGRILVLLRQGVPAHRIVLTTFSRDATDDMLARLEQWLGVRVGILANTIDGLARQLLVQYAPELADECEHVGEYKDAFLRLLRSPHHPYHTYVLQSVDYVLVDEYQDINDTYYGILEAFVRAGARLTAVGDDAQSIYGWNGAELQHLLEFGAHVERTGTTYPHQTFYLTRNFRSTPEVLAVANQSIVRNVDQLPKTIEASKPSVQLRPEVRFYATWDHEAAALVPDLRDCLARGETVAVLCRACTPHGPLYHFEAECVKHRVPHRLLERGRGVRRLVHREQDQGTDTDTGPALALTLCTIHKSKGLEWDHVVVLGCADTYFPSPLRDASPTNAQRVAHESEERRLFYVAATRAKRRLVFTFSGGRGDTTPSAPKATATVATTEMSRFLSELPRSLFTWKGVRPAHYARADATPYAATDGGDLTRALQSMAPGQWVQLRERLAVVLAAHGVVYADLTTVTDVHREHAVPEWVDAHRMHADAERFVLHALARAAGPPSHPLMERMLKRVALTRREYAAWRATDVTGDVTNSSDPLVHKARAKLAARARLLGIPEAALHPSPRTNLPNAVRERLQRMGATYLSDGPWEQTWGAAFEVSWCAALEHGRFRTLYQAQESCQAWVASLEPVLRAAHAAVGGLVGVGSVEGESRALHVPVDGGAENAGAGDTVHTVYIDELELVAGRTLFEVRMNSEWTAHDAVTQLVRLAHASTGTGTRTWSAAHVYYPWSGTLRTTDTAHVTAEAWRAVWVVARAVLRGDAMDVDADEAGVGGRAHVALTVETEPWAVAMARG